MDANKVKELDSKYILHTYGRFDVVFDHAKGAVVWDKNGKEYIDFTSGIGVNSFGFCDEGWKNALKEQIDKFQHTSNLYFTEPGAVLAEKIVKKSGLKKVLFQNSGAEANEAAIKLARKYGKVKGRTGNAVISLEHSFHGRTLATVTATARPEAQEFFEPLPVGFAHVEVGNIEALAKLADETDACGIILEVVQGEGGVKALDKDYVKAIRELCDSKDIIMIIDEVQSGAGRTGTFFAFEQFDIMPDIVTFAKGMGGGLPIGGMVCGEKVSDVFVPGEHGSTFAMNPIVCAGANYVVDHMDDAFLASVKEKAAYIREKLEAIDEVAETTGLGMMIGVVLKTKDKMETINALLENGLLTLPAADKVRLLPPLNITYEEIDRGLEVFKKVLG